MKYYAVNAVAIILMSVSAFTVSMARPSYSGGWTRTSVGLRLGWNGGPNGLTIRRNFAPGQAFEVIAGYNDKYGGRSEIPALKAGNTFIGISYAPFLLVSEGNVGVALVGDVGIRANYHHYRYISRPDWGAKITPEITAGGGIQIEFSESVEIFADLHLKYFSDPHNYYVPGMESGLGVRIAIN